MNNSPVIYSIGHSNHSAERFCELLKTHRIAVIADVRCYPVSKFVPHFDKKSLSKFLSSRGIGYRFFGRELGGKREDEMALTGGRMDAEKIRGLPDFRSGIERLLELARDKRTAIMCGEGDPKRCHRHWLIAQDLLDKGAAVVHILPDGAALQAPRERGERQLGLFG